MADDAKIKELEDANKALLASREADKARLVAFAAQDVERFLSSDQAVRRIPLGALKSGNAKTLLSILAKMEAEGTGSPVKFAAADGNETSGSVYELAKSVFLSMPEKISKDEETETVKDGADDDATVTDTAALAGADPDSIKQDQAAQKLMFAAKAKGEKLDYLDALRQVEMAQARK